MAGAAWAVSWDKESFWGRNRSLPSAAAKNTPDRGLLVTGRGIPRNHCEVKDADGNVIGEVTSGTFSPTLKRGHRARPLRPLGQLDEVVIDVRGRAIPATVTAALRRGRRPRTEPRGIPSEQERRW